MGEFDQQYLKAAEAVELKLVAPSVHGLSLADLAILVLALCFHAIFEGLAIGLSATSKDAWKTTSSIVIHKVRSNRHGAGGNDVVSGGLSAPSGERLPMQMVVLVFWCCSGHSCCQRRRLSVHRLPGRAQC